MKLGVLCDYREEGWPSMDLAGDALLGELAKREDLQAVRIQPTYGRRLQVLAKRLPRLQPLQRFSARLLEYPAQLLRRRAEFDAFHVVDHSYAHLALALPAGRTGIFCHDVDAFRQPSPGDQTRPFARGLAHRGLSNVLLGGLRRARVVFYSTQSVRDELEEHHLVEPSRLVHAPFGTSPEFHADGRRDAPPPCEGPFLVQVGGHWLPEHQAYLARHRLEDWVLQVRGLPTARLASLYRAATCVLMPTRREGFGLPLIEAIACNALVAASDLPVLREVGGDAAVYFPLDDLEGWTRGLERLLSRVGQPSALQRRQQSARYSWHSHADRIARTYAAW